MDRAARIELVEIAAEYVHAGISIIPLKLDGTKAPFSTVLPTAQEAKLDPAVPADHPDLMRKKPTERTWIPYQYRLPTQAELSRWFAKPAGIATLCGAISGGMEVIDFDDWTCFEPWKDLLPPSIASRLTVIETGGGGFHVPYRCQQIAGNAKLAFAKPTPTGRVDKNGRAICESKVRIETRGQGGYIVAVGSPTRIHSSGNPYVQVAGLVLPELPTITPAERKQLWQAAKSFDESGSLHPKVDAELKRRKQEAWEAKKAERPNGDITPWDDFDQRGDFSFLNSYGELRGNTWHRARSDNKKMHPSAVIRKNDSGNEVLVCFSTSLPAAIQPKSGKVGTAYGKWHVYKHLVHNGDWLAAAKDLYRKGYGKQYGNGDAQ